MSQQLTILNHPKTIKGILYIYIICFIFGGLRHWSDILNAGILPYKDAPILFNLFLTSLSIFDFIVVVLLFIRPLFGVILAIIIMGSDLVIDFYLSYQYWHRTFLENHALQLLLIFGIFLFLIGPIIIKASTNHSSAS